MYNYIIRLYLLSLTNLYGFLMIMDCIIGILIAFFTGLACLVILKKISLKNKILMPKRVPLVGGISLGFSFVLTVLIILGTRNLLSPEIIGLILSSTVMLIAGIIDDLRELSVTAKFISQLIAVSILVSFGVRTQIVYIGTWLNIAITFFWVVGINNAFNFLDVADGLAGSIALIVSASFALIAFWNNDFRILFLSLTLTVSILSFLIYNLPPAKVYMGNSGSHFLGFVLAVIAIMISYAPMERKLALLSPIFILGLPIFDALFLILMRLHKRKMPFNKSNDHLVLRVLSLGYSKKKTLVVMIVFGLFFSLSGVALSRTPNFISVAIIAVVILVSVISSVRMSRIT